MVSNTHRCGHDGTLTPSVINGVGVFPLIRDLHTRVMRLISLEGAENGGAIPSSVDMATDLPARRGWPFELPNPPLLK